MKKLIFSAALVAAILAGCGEEAAPAPAKETETAAPAATETQAPAEEVKEEPKTKSNVEENDDMRVEMTYSNKELGITGEAGPMKYNIPAIQLKEVTLKSEQAATLFEGAAVGDVVHTITIALDGENTSENDMNFYLGQATVITNTKEQLEPDMLLSEHIEGEYLGQVAHEGYNVYVLNKSTVDELETVEIRISAPTDATTWDSFGDEIKHVIEVNK